MTDSRTTIPEILWYQDKGHVFLSYQVLNAKDTKVTFSPSHVDFSATGADETKFSVNVECFREFDIEKSSWSVLGREVMVKLAKKDKENWLYLLKTGKSNWAHTLYDSEESEPDYGGFGMDGMGPGDFPGDMDNIDDHEDSDNETSDLKDKDSSSSDEEEAKEDDVAPSVSLKSD
ncbi:hypothetical protein MXB_3569 [Myxobolus squamalis]|nr:hypothetical protein MXB_3569 [Myxobolus squamalis]